MKSASADWRARDSEPAEAGFVPSVAASSFDGKNGIAEA